MLKSGISYIDLGIVITLIVFIYKGFARGFTAELMRILGTIIGLVLAVRYMSNVSKVIVGGLSVTPTVAVVISFAAIFIGIILLFKYISDKLKKAISFSMALGNADKIVGGAMGLAKGAIVVSLVTILISFIPLTGLFTKHFS